MTTASTTLLGLALPVTGELSGTWGDTVNNAITSLLDSAVAGTTTLSADADVTLSTTVQASNQAREAIILWTAGGTVTRNITAPAQSKTYIVINKSSSTQSIVLRGVGPTTGVTILAGEYAVCAWNGSDFVKVGNQNGIGNFVDLIASGNVGVGTTSPAAKTEIYSPNNSVNPFQVRYNGSNDVMGFGIGNLNAFPYLSYNTKSAASSDTPTYDRTAPAAQLRMDNGAFKFSIAPSGTAGTAISFTQAMTLDASGNLVIGGTQTAQANLDIQNNSAGLQTTGLHIGYSAASYYGYRIVNVNNPSATFGGLFKIQRGAGVSPPGSLWVDDLVIDNTGNVLIGQASATATLGTSIQVTNLGSLGQYAAGAGSSANTFTFGRDNVTTGNFVFVFAGSLISTISASTGAYTQISDKRVKKNITSLQYGLSEILKLNPVTYNMVSEEDTVKKHIGLIAQEVKSVMDEAVDDLIDHENQMYGLDKSALVPVLIKAIQEQQALITSLTARIAALEAK